MRFSVIHMLFFGVILTFAGSGAAQTLGDGGTIRDSRMGVEGGDGSASDRGDDGSTPIACDGALCDTTNGSSCTLVSNTGRDGSLPSMIATGALLAAGLARRARRKELRPRDETS